MADTLTAVSEFTSRSIPRVRVDFTLGTAGLPVSVYRIEASGAVRPLRGSPVVPVLGVGRVYDWEAPYNAPVRYRATNGAVTLDSLGVLLPDPGMPVLLHPGTPELSARLTVSSWPSWRTTTPRGVFAVIGRKLPVIVTSRRGGGVGDLVVYTLSTRDTTELRNLLADGVPLLLKGSSVEGAVDRWVSVGDVSEDGQETTLGSFVVWGLSLTETDAPIFAAPAAVTYADASAVFLSYADASGQAPTYVARSAGAWKAA